MEIRWIVIPAVMAVAFISLGIWAYKKRYIRPGTWKWSWGKVWLILTAPIWLPLGLLCLFKVTVWVWMFLAWAILPAPAPDPNVIAEAERLQERQVETVKKMVSLRNCLSANAKATAFGPMVTANIPASNPPVWGFAGILPPRAGDTTARVNPHFVVPDWYQSYMVCGGVLGKPLLPADLESQSADFPRKASTVVPLGKLPYDKVMACNKGADITIYYFQSNSTEEQKIDIALELPEKVEQFLVEVGREEVVLEVCGSEQIWIVPIWDPQYYSSIGNDLVAISGVSDTDWEHKYSQMKPPPGGQEATKQFAELAYQSLTIKEGGGDAEVFTRHRLVTPSEDASGQKIHLQLNARPTDLLAGICRPAKVLVGRRKTAPASSWGLMATN